MAVRSYTPGQQSKWTLDRRARMREQGLCEVCGKSKWEGTTQSLCHEHYQLARDRNRRNRVLRRQRGLCIDCNRPSENNGQAMRCGMHAQRRYRARYWFTSAAWYWQNREQLEGHHEEV